MIGMSGPDTQTRYEQFAELEARGNSAVYEQWALAVAADGEFIARLDELPQPRRQPNLLFGAARFLGLGDVDAATFTTWVKDRWDDVTAVMRTRSTQTNEAARCATLLPALSHVSGPLALIEVGASAGVCLFPDRYSYRYATPHGEVTLDPDEGTSPVVLSCRTTADVDVTMPNVIWRAGLDLNPLDSTEPDTRAWLRSLVWPGQDDRLARLVAALDVVATDPPSIMPGDLSTDLTALIDKAPDDATVVVFHSAVLAYVEPAGREAFRDSVSGSRATWISNEGAGVFPDISSQVPGSTTSDGRFLLAVDGEPVAFTGPHGQSYEPLPIR